MATSNRQNRAGAAKRSGHTLKTRSLAALVSGATLSGVLAAGGALGFIKPASATSVYSGITFLDIDGNGIQSAPNENPALSEIGIPGVTVNIYATDGTLVGSTVSGKNGVWNATLPVAGPFRVEFTNFPANAYQGFNPTFTHTQFPNTGTVNYGLFGKINSLGELTDITAENNPVNVGDRVWRDNNGNGVQDPGEPGINGVLIELVQNGNVVQTATTDANGNYYFGNLPKNSAYVIRVANNAANKSVLEDAGLVLTVKDATSGGGTDQSDSDGVTVNNLAQISVTTPTAGANYSFDFGYKPAPVVTTTTTIATTTTTAAPRYTLGDYVFLDANGNGVQDAGDSPVAGATVELLDANGNRIGAPVVTGADGRYTFTDLAPGNYTVRFTKPAGADVRPTSSKTGGNDATDSDIVDAGNGVGTVSVNLTGNNVNVDAGWVANPVTTTTTTTAPAPRYTLGDRVFIDTNRNGVQDAGEPGVEGATVELLDANGNRIGAPVVTGADGLYSFNNLLAGNYTVRFTRPAGSNVTLTAANQGGNDATDSDATPAGDGVGTASVNLTANNNTVDAGWVTPTATTTTTTPAPRYTLGDRVFLDSNRNGVQDAGEPGVAGATVELFDTNGNRIGQPIVTGADGSYQFNNLLAGTYVVRFTRPSGSNVTLTAANQGGNDATDSDATPAGDAVGSATVNLTANNNTVDAGWVTPVDPTTTTTTTAPAPRYTLGNRVFLDNNRNGIQDAGDAPVEGAKVELLNAAGTVIDTKTTDANGFYQFTNLLAGNYTVRFTRPDGTAVVLTTPNVVGSTDSNDSDAQPTTTAGVGTASVTLTSNNDTVDAGWVTPIVPTTTTTTIAPAPRYTLGNRVFFDTNGNGIQDAGEAGVPGVLVELLDASNRVIDTKLTDANGVYGFDNLLAGNYTVRFTRPAGSNVVLTTPNAPGSTGSNDSDARPTTTAGVGTASVTLTGNNDTVDAGWYAPLVLGDYVWNDADNDGTQDPGEDAIAGVTVELFRGPNATGTPIATQTTPDNGKYLFENLAPGQYSVRFTRPAGSQVVPTRSNVGSDITDSDAVRENNSVAAVEGITLTANNLNVDSGWYGVNLGDTVWLDSNRDGVRQGSESGIAGVTVELYAGGAATGTPLRSTTTNGSGNYLFRDLSPNGTYTVKVVRPDSLNITPANRGTDRAIDSNFTASGVDGVATVTLGTTDDLTVDSGWYATGGTIGDKVFIDENADGTQDLGEPALSGVFVELLDANGNPIPGRTTRTDANGNYSFTDVPTGTYRVRFTRPDGTQFTPTAQNQGDNATDSDGRATAPGQATTDAFSFSGTGIDRTIDQGFVRGGLVLGDYVFYDNNANGVQDAGDDPIEGVRVELLDRNGAPVASTNTDANGRYQFTGLTAGTYSVRFTGPAGTSISPTGRGTTDTDSNGTGTGSVASTNPFVLNASNQTIDQGFIRPAAPRYRLGDLVFLDNNRDGIQNTGDTPVVGARVELLDANGNVLRFTTTDIAGNYVFNVEPGTYRVRVIGPDGTTLSPARQGTSRDADSNGTVVGNSAANVATSDLVTITNADNVSIDQGFVPSYTIGDRVFIDTNGNGIQDAGEPGAPRLTVELLDEAGTRVFATTTTNADGRYQFTDVPAGSYRVRFTGPDGATVSPTSVGADRGQDSNGTATANGTATTGVITVNGNDNTIDQGFIPRATGFTIGDLVFFDNNRDGNQDPGDTAVVGARVELLDVNGTVIRTTTSGADGRYSFTNVPAGRYQVRFIGPDGTTLSPTGTNAALNNDSNGTGTGNVATTPFFNLSADDNTVDQGFIRPAATTTTTTAPGATTFTVGDLVWDDTNGNGVRDANEAGIGGVLVELLNSNGAVVGTTTTSSSGAWTISGVPNGTYTIRLSRPAGYEWTVQGSGNDRSNVNSSGVSPSFTVNGASITSLDAGLKAIVTVVNTAPATPATIATTTTTAAPATPAATFCIGDKIFSTATAGAKDGNGIANVKVALVKPDGTSVETTTDSSGKYQFCSLTAGTYTVKVNVPSLPANSTAVYDIANKLNNEATVAVTNASNNDADFGYKLPTVPNVAPATVDNTTPPTTTPAPAQEPAFTGSNSTTMSLWALALMMIGLGLAGLVTDRRRQAR